MPTKKVVESAPPKVLTTPDVIHIQEREYKQVTSGTCVQWHGTKGSNDWAYPFFGDRKHDVVGRSDVGNTIKANEFLDHEDVLEAKVDILADKTEVKKRSWATRQLIL
jgi:hypothetical protein